MGNRGLVVLIEGDRMGMDRMLDSGFLSFQQDRMRTLDQRKGAVMSKKRPMKLPPPVARYPTIAGIMVLATLLFLFEELTGTDLAREYGTAPERIQHAWTALLAGHWDRATVGALSTLLTALFLHGDIEHLAYNMLFLWAFGALRPSTSANGGRGLFFSAVRAATSANLLNPNSAIPIIGASGAVCGFEGIYLGLAMRGGFPGPISGHWPTPSRRCNWPPSRSSGSVRRLFTDEFRAANRLRRPSGRILLGSRDRHPADSSLPNPFSIQAGMMPRPTRSIVPGLAAR